MVVATSDRTAVEEAVRKQRMSVKTAKAEWEAYSGKKYGRARVPRS